MSIPRVENLQSKNARAVACAEGGGVCQRGERRDGRHLASGADFPSSRKNIYSFLGKDLTNRSFSDIMLQVSAETGVYSTQKYSSGRRGAPAKGIGRETGARVQIPPSPFK